MYKKQLSFVLKKKVIANLGKGLLRKLIRDAEISVDEFLNLL